MECSQFLHFECYSIVHNSREIMLRSEVSKKIYVALSPLFQNIPGGLLHTNIAVCTLFGAVSGSSLSTAAAVGSVAYPEMTERGYDKKMVVGSLAGGGTLVF